MMKLHGHPWSINTRKALMTFAEKGHEPSFVLVMIPKGEHKRPDHLRIHPFGKVPILDDDGFVLYETRAINAYLDATLPGRALTPKSPRERARMDQWINVADSYFTPFAHPLIVERLFRRFLGGEPNQAVIDAGRTNMVPALDVLDDALANRPYLAGETFSLADVHWMPYLEYLARLGEDAPITARPNVTAWWRRIAARPSWQQVARTGPQPDDAGVSADVIEKIYR
jgi:glutathione S-transferase